MSTNVKAGDRAIVVSAARPENLYIIVDVLHQAEPYLCDGVLVCNLPDGNTQQVLPGRVVWVVESLGRDFVNSSGRLSTVRVRLAAICDHSLRPLRDSKGDDEMLLRAGPAPQRGRITEWEGVA